MEAFENYFKRADVNQDGKISGSEAVAFFQGSGLPQQVLAQIWMYADQNKSGFLGRPEFFNALRLVTVAQGGHALKPDIVKSALYGPAAAKIPPPKINSVPMPTPQASPVSTPQIAPSTQMGLSALSPAQYAGARAPQSVPPNMAFNQQTMRPSQTGPLQSLGVSQGLAGPVPSQSPLQTPGVSLGLARGNTGMGPRPVTSSTMGLSADWLGNKTDGPQPRAAVATNNTDAFGLSSLTSTMGVTQRPQAQPTPASSILSSYSQPAVQPSVDSKALVLSQNGPSSAGSGFGNDMFGLNSQAKPSTSIVPVPATTMPSSSPQISFAQLDPLRSTQVPTSQVQVQPTQVSGKQDLATPNVSAGVSTQPQWPKMTKSDVNKYTKVFSEVDKDRDGRITGLEARNLFLSWKLPREVLKQVWDLSDQDNDGMLTLREFCIALYLMEKHRQGATLPKQLPDSLRYDETLLQATGLPTAAYASPAWQQANRPPVPGAAPVMGVMRPPLPGQMHPHARAAQTRSSQPGMDNNHVNRDVAVAGAPQTQEVAAAEKKAPEIEKQILDSKEKIEYFRNKMQDLVLYKSRCDNRLNEITERALSDKREVESLAKKYEEKYKQVGEIASKLAVEEASIRDIHERKTELQNAVVKMEQGGSADGLLQVRADRIQYQLEELEKAMAERCKHFGLHVKPSSSSIELPFGWEPGAPEGAMDWDEDWDKFEDEGFMIVKANTAEVEHVTPSEKDRTASLWNDDLSVDGFSPVASSSNGHVKSESHFDAESNIGHSEEESPGRRSTFESPFVSSPRIKDDFIDRDGAESSIFGDQYANEASWNFDDTDTESVWGANTLDADHQRNSFFSSGGDFGLDPVRVNSPSASSIYGKKKSSFFDDSVPSSPSFSTTGFSPKFNDASSFNYGRFDSFKTEDSASGFFGQDKNSSHFARFDSISSSKGDTLSRFDSTRSTTNVGHNRGFDSFDERDPFGSAGPFKASGSRSPPRF